MSEQVSAKDVFSRIAEEMNIKIEDIGEEVEEKPEVRQEIVSETKKKRRYIGKSARINSELMKEVLRELKRAYERSYQPEVVASIERAVRLLKVIIKENEDVFPGILKPNSED